MIPLSEIATVIAALCCAGGLGYAAHRGGICTVKAVGEILSTRRAFMLISLAKAAAWSAAIAWPLWHWFPETFTTSLAWTINPHAFAGGFLFGIGAAINGGCAISTLSRLANGEAVMTASLVGIVSGAALALSIPSVPATLAIRALDVSAPFAAPWILPGIVVLWVWCSWEMVRLWRTRPEISFVASLLDSSAFRLSAAALVIGVANGFLIPATGGWSYVGTFITNTAVTIGVDIPGGSPTAMRWILFATILSGMFMSSWQRRSFRIRFAPTVGWATALLGGVAMGFGSAIAPGGNEYLILQGIPELSPHGAFALVSLLAGIAAAIGAMRVIGRQGAEIDCAGDICRSQDATRP